MKMTASPFPPSPLARRHLLQLFAGGVGVAVLAGCASKPGWHNIDVAGSSPPLNFTLTRAPDGQEVSAADYRGQIVLLYLGYTFCPDVCPTTLANIAEIMQELGVDAAKVTVLFVTVDPNRDTLPVLANYVTNFGTRIVGLRGSADQLASLARRYRLVYSVTPASKDHPYEVTHSSAIYVFDATGAARLLIPTLAAAKPDTTGIVADLKRLIAGTA